MEIPEHSCKFCSSNINTTYWKKLLRLGTVPTQTSNIHFQGELSVLLLISLKLSTEDNEKKIQYWQNDNFKPHAHISGISQLLICLSFLPPGWQEYPSKYFRINANEAEF